MIRLSEIKLPLAQAEQPEAPLRAAAAAAAGPADAALARLEVFKRSFDARKADLLAGLHRRRARWPTRRREPAVLRAARRPPARRTHARHGLAPARARPAPPPDAAPGGGRLRPLRHLRGAGAGADGPQAHRAGARQAGARAHQGHLGPVAQERAAPREQRAVRRRRRRHLLRRQALQPDQGPAPPRPQGDGRVRQGRRARRRSCTSPIRTSAPSSW